MFKYFFVAFAIVLSTIPAFADTGCLNEGCHRKLLDNRFVHGPVAVGECSYCHTQAGKHSFKPATAGDALCADCHELKARGIECGRCHDPHGSGREFHLKDGSAGKCIK